MVDLAVGVQDMANGLIWDPGRGRLRPLWSLAGEWVI